MKKHVNSPNNFSEEILLMICSYSDIETLKNIALVSKQLNRIVKDEKLPYLQEKMRHQKSNLPCSCWMFKPINVINKESSTSIAFEEQKQMSPR